MTNNDVLRRIRYTYDFSDPKVIEIFSLAELSITRDELKGWLKRDDDEGYVGCGDRELATFLNGLIINNRGKQEGPTPEPEKKLNNNIIFRKLKIALDLKNDDVLDLLSLAGITISKHELSAFFRRPDHKHFRKCKDQLLRNFLQGIQLKIRPTAY